MIKRADKVDHDTGEILTADPAEVFRPEHDLADHFWKPTQVLRAGTIGQVNYNTNAVSRETALYCKDPTLAQQQFREDSDINTLVERFGITGTMPQLDRIPIQADFIGITDYKSAMDALIAADNEFMKLPADMRARFDNDPQKFLDFTSNEANYEEIAKLGLLKKPEPRPHTAEDIAVAIKTGSAEAKPVT